MSVWIWIKIAVWGVLILAGLLLALLAVVRRKSKWIIKLIVGILLLALGTSFLLGFWMQTKRERTLAHQRNYVAVKLMEMGDYANATSMAAQADQLMSNAQSKELLVLAAGFRMNVELGQRYANAYLEELAGDSVIEDARKAFEDFLDGQAALDQNSEEYDSENTKLQEELRGILMTLLYQVEKSIPSYADNASVQSMLAMVQQGYYDAGQVTEEDDSPMGKELEAAYAIQTADFSSMMDNAKQQLAQSDSFENRANAANIAATQSWLYEPLDQEIQRLNQEIQELEQQRQELYNEYVQLTDEQAQEEKQQELEAVSQQILEVREKGEIKTANQAINFIEITTPIEERNTVVYKIELARLYYQARKEDKAEEFMKEALEEAEKEDASTEAANMLLMEFIEKYKISSGDEEIPSYWTDGTADPAEVWNILVDLFGFFDESAIMKDEDSRDFYSWLLQVMDEHYHGLIIRNVDTVDYPTVRVTVNVTTDVERELTKEDFSIWDMGNMVQDFTLLGGAAEGEGDTMSMVLAVDRSGSMEGSPMTDTQAAVSNFVRTAEKGMRIGLVTFDDVTETTPISTNRSTIQRAVSETYARGGTNIAQGLSQAGSMLASESGQKIIILLSDGADGSPELIEEVLDELNRKNIIVYTIGFDGADSSYLSYIAQRCGGQFIQAASSEVLGTIYADIGSTMSNDYVLEFTASQETQRLDRFLEVTLNTNGASREEEYQVGVTYEEIQEEQGQAPLADYFRQIGGSDREGGEDDNGI